MIAYLSGVVVEKTDDSLVLGIGERSSGGVVGYTVFVPHSHEYNVLEVGGELELYVYTHVREDALDLYGFLTATEKELFLILIRASGIGPKAATKILSSVHAMDFVRAVLEGDKEFLTAIPGVGKKTAERMILELADALRKKYGDRPLDAQVAASTVMPGSQRGGAGLYPDAKEALIQLGIQPQTAEKLLNQALLRLDAQGREVSNRVEDLIREALRAAPMHPAEEIRS